MPKKKQKKPDKRDQLYCWVIAYIDYKFLNIIKPQLMRLPEYREVEVCIPTIKVLKKTFKGKNQFDEVPLLFNYGFFKIPRVYAIHRNYLENLQKNVTAISGWVKDPAKELKQRKGESTKGDNRYIAVAVASSAEVSRLLLESKTVGAHNAQEIDMVQPGQMITLKGYPWDGVEAEFVSKDDKRKKVIVKMILFGEPSRPIEVSYDNVFFTVYHNHNFDDSLTIKNSLDDLQAKNKLDKLQYKSQSKNGKAE